MSIDAFNCESPSHGRTTSTCRTNLRAIHQPFRVDAPIGTASIKRASERDAQSYHSFWKGVW